MPAAEAEKAAQEERAWLQEAAGNALSPQSENDVVLVGVAQMRLGGKSGTKVDFCMRCMMRCPRCRCSRACEVDAAVWSRSLCADGQHDGVGLTGTDERRPSSFICAAILCTSNLSALPAALPYPFGSASVCLYYVRLGQHLSNNVSFETRTYSTVHLRYSTQ